VTVNAGFVSLTVSTFDLTSGTEVAITSSNPALVLGEGEYTGPSTGAGTLTVVVGFRIAGVYTITASEVGLPSIASPAITVLATPGPPGPPQFLGVSAPSSANGGAPFNFTVTAYDGGGNVATSYSGTVAFTSSDPNATLPGSTTLTNGTGTFSATLKTLGTQIITATDTVTGSISGTSGNILVSTSNLVVNQVGDDGGNASNCSVQPAGGTTTNIDTCYLRDALLQSALLGSANITFDSTVFLSTNSTSANTINLTTGTLTIPTNTSISGPTSGSGASLTNLVTVAGGGSTGNFPVFTVPPSVIGSSITSLIITNGSYQNGGGINNSGGLAVVGSTIFGNAASLGGAGIYNNGGTLSLYHDTISGNTVTNTSSSGAAGGGILNTGAISVINCTLAGNTAISGRVGTGGAIASSPSGSLALVSSTISGNSSDGSAGGVSFVGGTAASNLLGYNILSGNSAPAQPDVAGPYTDDGGNLVDVSNIEIAPLGNFGGLTQTMVPLPGSPAICAVNETTTVLLPNLATDQRGDPMDPVCPSNFVDSGAVQANYALAFTTQPPSNAIAGVALSPAPVVTLTESGAVFAPATSTVTIADGKGALSLSGTNSAALSAGTATFSHLILSSVESGDTLTASLSLNPNLSPALSLVSPPSTGVNVGAPGPPFGHLELAADSATASSTVAQSDLVLVKGWAADQVDGAPLSNVKLYIDGNLVGRPTMGIARPDVATAEGAAYLDSGYQLTYSAATLSLGSHSVTVTAIDSGSRSTTFGPLTFTVAAGPGVAPPFGHLDSVVDSVTASSTVAQLDSVVVKGWAADQIDGAPLSNVKVYIDGNLAGTPTLGIARSDVAAAEGAAYLNSGYTLTYSVAALSLGSHSVTVIAIDSGARSTTFGPLAFTVAAAAGTAPPPAPFGHLDSAVDSVTGTSTVPQSDSVVVKGWAADQLDGAPLSNVKVYIDGILAGTPNLGIARSDVSAAEGSAYLDSGYKLTSSAATLALGPHSVTVIAIDSQGRSTTFGPLAFTVAAPPPFGHLDSALDSVTASNTVSQSDSVVMKGWAADQTDGAPLSNVKVYIDGTLIGTPTLGIARPDVAAAEGAAYLDSGYKLTYSAATLALGSHSVTVIAIDSGGRTTTFGPLAFTVQ
jgi:hypothetical protein